MYMLLFLSIGYSFMKTQWNKYKGAVGDTIAHSLKEVVVKYDIWETLCQWVDSLRYNYGSSNQQLEKKDVE